MTVDKAKDFELREAISGSWSRLYAAEFADSLTAELQKENARLKTALERLIVVFVQRELDTDDFDEIEMARAALNPPEGGAVQQGLSKEKAK